MMTSSQAFVWVWLPGALEPVVAGRLDDRGSRVTFTYGRSYLERGDAISLWLDLPLERGEQSPKGNSQFHGAINDAGPDYWGRRVIESRREGAELDPLAYLLDGVGDRVGALAFRAVADRFDQAGYQDATLEQLAEAADYLDRREPLPPPLNDALLHGSSVGGARPKALLRDGDRALIAKFSSTSDSMPVVQAEYVAMSLARYAGLDVAPVELVEALNKQCLLVKRFDRPRDGTRRLLVTALTIHDHFGRTTNYPSYVDLADYIRASFTNPTGTLHELFSRIAFNILIGNTDDHSRNHAAFWDGHDLALTSAYDICPQPRTGGAASQAMAYGLDGQRSAQTKPLVANAHQFQVDTSEAVNIVEGQQQVIRDRWQETCDAARLTKAQRDFLWERQFLNPYTFYDEA